MDQRQGGQNLKSVSSIFHLGGTCLADSSALIWAADSRDSEENLPVTSLVNDYKKVEIIAFFLSKHSFSILIKGRKVRDV